MATGDMIAGAGRRYVAKAEVPFQLWHRLIGVQHPERL
jgi:hypothetical protein